MLSAPLYPPSSGVLPFPLTLKALRLSSPIKPVPPVFFFSDPPLLHSPRSLAGGIAALRAS